MPASTDLRVELKGKGQEDSEYIELKLIENEGFSQEIQSETFKQTGPAEDAQWDIKKFVGRGFTFGGTILDLDEDIAEINKLEALHNATPPDVTVRWSIGGLETGQKFLSGDAIFTSFTRPAGTGTSPRITMSFEGSGKVTSGTH